MNISDRFIKVSDNSVEFKWNSTLQLVYFSELMFVEYGCRLINLLKHRGQSDSSLETNLRRRSL
jgi:hypothetical protein